MVYDYLIIGAGIVGLATAYQIHLRDPGCSIAILEKEVAPALHQTGRNSGVVHTGIYYKPQSLKAQNCVAGRKELVSFCDEYGISYKKIHKVILATKKEELPMLEILYAQGKANGVAGVEKIGPERLKEIEPYASAFSAIFIPECHIIDYSKVAEKLASFFEMHYQTTVLKIGQSVETSKGSFQARKIVNCAGLYSDRLAGGNWILPFRGEYYELTKTSLVKGLIYPVPDMKFPFLGVHLTPMMNGKVEAGPNAVLAMGREAYARGNWGEVIWLMQHPGFWKMALKYWRAGAYELMRSMNKSLFLRDLQRLVPSIQATDLIPGGCGIRAQVVTKKGKLMDDFAFQKKGNILHVINAPSPAATASFSIGKKIANEVFT